MLKNLNPFFDFFLKEMFVTNFNCSREFICKTKFRKREKLEAGELLFSGATDWKVGYISKPYFPDD